MTDWQIRFVCLCSLNSLELNVKYLYLQTASVYQLQRRVRTLKEQLEKKDLHLDMLRKKIMVLEESVKMRTTLELERDEALSRARKHIKQIERLELELKEARLNSKDVKGQLADATEYKVIKGT